VNIITNDAASGNYGTSKDKEGRVCEMMPHVLYKQKMNFIHQTGSESMGL
jgi:hypothetical protein